MRSIPLLGRTRTYSGMRSLYKKMAGDPYEAAKQRYRMTGDVQTLLDQAYGPRTYQRDDARKKNILEHYRFSLERMARLARSAGIAVLLVTPASNLKDCSPFKSEHRSGLTASQRRKFSNLLAQGKSLAAEGKLEKSLGLFDEAVAMDDRHSEALYRKGKVLFRLGRYQEAEKYLIKARDEDVCPLRALTPMVNTVRKTAAENGIPLIDFARNLEGRSYKNYGHAVLGEEDFLDHVHISVKNHGLLARAIVGKMAEQGLLTLSDSWGKPLLSGIAEKFMMGFDRESHGIALHNLAKVLNWAGKYEDAARLAERALADAPHYLESFGSHLYVGTAQERRGERDSAMVHYRMALAIDSNNAEPRRLLGSALEREGKLAEAEKHLYYALHLEPNDPGLIVQLGEIWLQLGKVDQAVFHYSRIVKQHPESTELRYRLAKALYQAGRLGESAEYFNSVIRLNARYAPAYEGLGFILEKQGRGREALSMYARALQIDPRLHEARRRLTGTLGGIK